VTEQTGDEANQDRGALPEWVVALIAITVIAALVLPFLGIRDLYYQDEARYGGIVQEMIARDAWLTMTIAGDPYLDKGPIYFAMFRLLAEFANSTAPWVFSAVQAVTAGIFVWSAHAFCRLIGIGASLARLTTLMILALPFTAAYAVILRMDLLFAAAIVLSFGMLVRGTGTDARSGWPIAGGALAGVAVLIKGPFGLIFPYLGLLATLLFQRRGRRVLARDVGAGFAIAIVLIAGWFGSLLVVFGYDALRNIAEVQLVERALNSVDGVKPWNLYLTNLPLTLLPWLILLLLLPFAGIAPPQTRAILAALCFSVVSLLVLQSVAQKSTKYLFPILPPLVLFLAIAHERLETRRPGLLSLAYAAIGVALILFFGLLGVGAALNADWLGDVGAVIPNGRLIIFSAIGVVAGVLPFLSIRLVGEARVLPVLATLVLTFTAFKWLLFPALNAGYSPRAIGDQMASLSPPVESVLVYRVYRGALSYHLNVPHRYVVDPIDIAEAEGEFAVITWKSVADDAPDLFADREELGHMAIENDTLIIFR